MMWPYPFFTEEEMRCKHTGECDMDPTFMRRLVGLRKEYDRPMHISSGYRSPKHPIEAAKSKPGAHATGHACDVSVRGEDAYDLIRLALKHGFTGIGVQQKGSGRFIHLDDLEGSLEFPRPTIWSY